MEVEIAEKETAVQVVMVDVVKEEFWRRIADQVHLENLLIKIN
jgi:hypothetical protein